jgi:hypothetical protein
MRFGFLARKPNLISSEFWGFAFVFSALQRFWFRSWARALWLNAWITSNNHLLTYIHIRTSFIYIFFWPSLVSRENHTHQPRASSPNKLQSMFSEHTNIRVITSKTYISGPLGCSDAPVENEWSRSSVLCDRQSYKSPAAVNSSIMQRAWLLRTGLEEKGMALLSSSAFESFFSFSWLYVSRSKTFSSRAPSWIPSSAWVLMISGLFLPT